MKLNKLAQLVAGIFLLVLSNSVTAKSMVWKVSKGGDHFYLGGTIHLLSEEDHPLPEEFFEAYNKADEIILETDIASAKSVAFQQKLMNNMMYRDGRSLPSELSDETYQQLKAFLSARDMPIEQFAPFQPWAVTLIVTIQEYTKLGMVPDYGVDSFMEQRAIKESKALQSLESVDAQLDFLTSLGNVDPNLSIEYFIRDLEKLPEIINTMKSSWRTGDVEKLAKSLDIAAMKEEFPSVYETILVKRNNAWMAEITSLFDDDAIELVLVGALHLAGEEGLLHQLSARGFTLQQLD